MKHPKGVKNQALELRQRGYSLNEIMSALSLSKSTVQGWIHNLPIDQNAKTIIENKRRQTGFQKHNTAWQRRRNFDSKTPPQPWTKTRIKEVQDLYNSGLSMKEVAEKMDETLWRVTSIMRSKNIKRRRSSETNEFRFRRSPLSFTSKANLTKKEQLLKNAGLMLYWGEGAKKNSRVDFVNSDVKMIKLFCKFLREIYLINKEKLRASIYCFSDQNYYELVSFWSRITKIPLEKFEKPYIKHAEPNKHGKIKHGVIHVRYADKRLLERIILDIKIEANKLASQCRGTQAVNGV